MKFPSFSLNPVLERESRVRMRGWKAPALVSLYVGLLGLVVWGIVAVANAEGDTTFAPEMGSIIFGFLAFAQFALLVFSAPGLTAGAISGEREKQTLDLLLMTRMTPWQVVTGKLGAAVGFSLLLLFASLPVYSILFMLGGLSLSRLLFTLAVYVVTVLFMGAIGIYYSAVFKRTQAAVVAAYGTAFGLIIGSFILSILIFQAFHRPQDPWPDWALFLAWINPAMGAVSAVGGEVAVVLGVYGQSLATQAEKDALWWQYCLFGITASVALLALTARRISPLKNQ